MNPHKHLKMNPHKHLPKAIQMCGKHNISTNLPKAIQMCGKHIHKHLLKAMGQPNIVAPIFKHLLNCIRNAIQMCGKHIRNAIQIILGVEHSSS